MNQAICKKQLRKFGLLIGIGFPLVIGLIIPAIVGHELKSWTLWIAVPALVLSFAAPQLLLYPYKGWMAIGHALGSFNNKIIFGILFYVVLLPIAYTMRLFGYDPLRINLRRSRQSSYRTNRKDHKTDLTRIF